MDRRVKLSRALLGAICTTFSASLMSAQIPRRLKGCSPYPTLADEIKEMQAEMAVPRPKIHVVSVVFVGADSLPESAKERVTHRAEDIPFDAGSDWPLYVAEDARLAMQDHGYFRATVRPQSHIVSSGPAGEEASVTLSITEGPKYRLGRIQFVDARVFPTAELRKQVPLRDGAIFDLSKLRAGIDALTKLYDAHGYINSVASPDVQIDDAHRRISVALEMDEGHQFRVGSVQILGLDQQVSNHPIKLEIKPGVLFSNQLIDEFYKQNKAILPADASAREDTTISQDARTHTVAIKLDFRGCPQIAQ